MTHKKNVKKMSKMKQKSGTEIIEKYYYQKNKIFKYVKISRKLLTKLIQAIDEKKLTPEIIQKAEKENIIIIKN